MAKRFKEQQMTKLFFLILTLSGTIQIYAQGKLPVIKATSSKVDIRVGSDYFLKGGWTLEADKNPDIFSIGSKWPYDSKKVTFTTNIDSISFDVQPGYKYDFVIMLNETIPCHIQIATLANPVFLNKKTAIPILAGFAIILIILYWNRRRLNNKILLRCGYAVTILFWVMTFISGQMHGNYNHFKNVISELGAIGTKSEFFTSSSLMLLSLLGILFSIGFYRTSKMKKLSVVPAILSFAMPVSLIWAGIFTLGNEFHGATGPLPFLIIIGSLLAYLLWRKNKELSALRKISLLSFIIMLLILTRFIKPFGIEYEGLTQRFFYAGWTIWTIVISYYLSKEVKTVKN